MDTSQLQQVKQRYGIVGNSDGLNRAIDIALQVANTDISVLINGESGTGKEIIPMILHDNSLRKRKKLFAINCGAIPEGTIDGELFGHEKGSFTGAVGESKGYFGVADGGTLFLDEVGELPLATQAKLLRVLEKGEYIRVGGQKVEKTDVRVVAATNVNLLKAISEGRFREDLYYRLNAIQIKLPPLRERGEDVLLLFRLFAMQAAEKYKLPLITLDEAAKQHVLNYKWPGNIRQLKNVTEQIAVLSKKKVLSVEDIIDFVPRNTDSTALAVTSPDSKDHSYRSEREALFAMIFELRNQIFHLSHELEQIKRELNIEDITTIEES
ncbi:MAG: sigma-54-dependent Fis family transcriptional regulator [Bacteroidaceae bacterium]|nr:sigma-54-dependent Fis family transcriptional regulator [Bacteroidaceae bacterium]